MAYDGGYLLDNQQAEAGARFDALATLLDPSTFRHIEALGIAAGWEVGASVPSWLAARVGPAGHVLATDVDVSWLADHPVDLGLAMKPRSTSISTTTRPGGSTRPPRP